MLLIAGGIQVQILWGRCRDCIHPLQHLLIPGQEFYDCLSASAPPTCLCQAACRNWIQGMASDLNSASLANPMPVSAEVVETLLSLHDIDLS